METYKFISFDPLIDVSGWIVADNRDSGTRFKRVLINPESGRYHLFKSPKQMREHQIWSELIASFIAGDLLGWDVHVARIAIWKGVIGNLLEYFYDAASVRIPQSPEGGMSKFPDGQLHLEQVVQPEWLIEGLNLCLDVDPDYDQKKGERHTLRLVLDIASHLDRNEPGLSREKFLDFWARTTAFDTLISNTDRHAENWAIIRASTGSRMAPLYDNGSSLGCSIEKKGLLNAFDADGEVMPSHLSAQQRKGHHHMRLDTPEKKGAKFEELCKRLLDVHPEGAHWFNAAANVNVDSVGDLLTATQEAANLPEPYSLNDKRRQHICAMLEMGKERLRNVANG